MRALQADHCLTFAGFDAKVAARWTCGRFFSIGTSALGCVYAALKHI